MRAAIVVPDRWASSRFPGKPLAMIAGTSLIQRVYERSVHSRRTSTVFVATDDDRPEELPEADALEPGALFGARRSLGPDQVEGEPRRCRRPGAGGQIGFHAREPYRVGCRS